MPIESDRFIDMSKCLIFYKKGDVLFIDKREEEVSEIEIILSYR